MPSSVVNYITYNDDERVLQVVFQSGMIYHYYEVPPEVVMDFKKSGSKGIFLNKVIKGNYTFKKIK